MDDKTAKAAPHLKLAAPQLGLTYSLSQKNQANLAAMQEEMDVIAGKYPERLAA